MSWNDDTPDRDEAPEESMRVEQEFDPELHKTPIEVYRIPTQTLTDLFAALDMLDSVKEKLDRHLTDTIIAGENPVEEVV